MGKERLKNLTQNDRAMDFICVLSFALTYLFIALVSTGGKYIFGASIDFADQHYVLPDYMRTLFYENYDLFPDFAFNLGGGLNIYSISYYGFLNPIILLSYLFPFVEMLDYIIITTAIAVLSAVTLFYFYLKKSGYGRAVSFLCAFLFLCASPITFHAHRHIMFINYMPFLVMGFYGIDKYIYKNKSWLLILSISLMIFTSYYFSISGMVALFIFGCFKFVRKNGFVFKDLFGFGLKAALRFITSVLTAAILILPTFYTLFSGRSGSSSSTSVWDLLKPGMGMLYGCYTMGLTAVALIAAIYMLFSKKIENVILSAVLLVVSVFPIFNYALNGFLYINEKSLIPFIPLVLVNTADFILYVKEKVKFKKVIFSYLIVIPLIVCITANKEDSYIKISDIRDGFNQEYEQSVSELVPTNSSYRINSSLLGKPYMNRVTNVNEYKTTIYSSVFSDDYRTAYRDLFENPLPYRNEFMISATNNPIFQTYMGEKYIYTEKEFDSFYELVDTFGERRLYKNPYAIPIGYATNAVINTEDFEKLRYPHKMLNMLGRAVVDKNTTAELVEAKEIREIDYTAEKVENVTYKKTADGFVAFAKEDANVVFRLSDPDLTGKLLLISFDLTPMAYKQEKLSDFDILKAKNCDLKITINEVANKLTDKNWKYFNRNTTFAFALVNDDNLLDIQLKAGTYEIKNFKVHSLEYEMLNKLKSNIDPFVIDGDKTKGDIISGNINVRNDGYFMLSVPYDKGFTVKVDGKEVEYYKANGAFIGFDISAGEHNVEIEYKAPLKNAGLIISLCGILLFVGILIFEGRRKNGKDNDNSSVL